MAIDSGSYSPQVLARAIIASAHVSSYAIGSELLEKLADISISSRHLNNLTAKIGAELGKDRDARTAAYFQQPLPRTARRAEMLISLATVSIDGGRMQTRLDGGGVGVHDPHWRESKNALFLRMSGVQFPDDPNPELSRGGGDVRYHLGYSSDWKTASGDNLHISLCFNPSHLEFVNTVAQGRTRCKQDRMDDEKRQQVMTILIHGDAAFAGEGIVQETLNLSELEGYRTGGTLMKAARALKDLGALDIYACITHGVFSGGIFENLEDSAISKLLVTNTIEVDTRLASQKTSKLEVLSVARLLGEAIHRIHREESLSSLFI